MGQITIVGLGPGPLELLTKQALDVLGTSKKVFLRTSKHPVARSSLLSATVVAFDELFDGESSRAVASQIVAERIVGLAERSTSVVYAVPGNPIVGDQSVRLILDLASARGFPVQVVSGVSTLDLAFQSLRVDPLVEGVTILDASQIFARHGSAGEPSFDPFSGRGRALDPTRPVLVAQVHGVTMLAALKRALGDVYPDDHPISVVVGPGPSPSDVRTVPLKRLDSLALDEESVCLYVRSVERLADLASFDTLRYIVARLRAPDGCPWDREQTHDSMKKHFIEETYEAIAALDEADWSKVVEELGDVMLQVVMHCQLGVEARSFDLEDVFRAVNEKLIRRHPHVFGDVEVSSSADVLRNWEKIKRSESATNRASFSNIPESMPALMRADAVQSRAARYGWTPPSSAPDVASPGQSATDTEEIKSKLGESLFDLVALARRHGVDPEEALRLATNRFATRLERALDALQNASSSFDQLPIDERRRLIRDALGQESASRNRGARQTS